MKTVIRRNSFGIVLDGSGLRATNLPTALSAQLILNNKVLDENGNLCVTGRTGFREIVQAIDSLKSELEELTADTMLWLLKSIASPRTTFQIISNDNHKLVGGAHCDGEGDIESAPPSQTL